MDQKKTEFYKKPWFWIPASLVIIFVYAATRETPPATEPVTASEKAVEVESQQEDRSTAAFVKAKRFISMVLKSPSTAKYPFLDGYTVENVGDDTYVVTSYVDSENSFGAMVRSEWSVTLKYLGGPEADTESWEPLTIAIDGEEVLP